MDVSKWITIHALLSIDELDTLLKLLDGTVVRVGTPGDNHIVEESSATFAIGDEDDWQWMTLPDDRRVARLVAPAILVKDHFFQYSKIDGKIRSMIHAEDSVSWGWEFSFPQLFQDKNGTIIHTKTLPNGKRFHVLQKWMRKATKPVSFEVDGKKLNTSIRIGNGKTPPKIDHLGKNARYC